MTQRLLVSALMMTLLVGCNHASTLHLKDGSQVELEIIWHSIPGPGEAIFFRRYYLAPDLLECETLNLSLGAPGIMPRLPTVIAFPDGYFLASWSAGTGSVSKIYLRYAK